MHLWADYGNIKAHACILSPSIALEGDFLSRTFMIHRQQTLDISRAITADSSPLHVASSRTQTVWFRAQVDKMPKELFSFTPTGIFLILKLSINVKSTCLAKIRLSFYHQI